MPSSVTLLGTETLLDTEDVPKTGQASLEVELRTLGEVRLGSVVVEFEESGSTFYLGLNHAGRGNFEETEFLVGGTERGEEGRAEFENVGRGLSADDKMPVIGEHIRRVALWEEAARLAS